MGNPRAEKERKSDSIESIAKDLAMRIRWEVENSGQGYWRVKPEVGAHDKGDAEAALLALQSEIGDCTRCHLHSTRNTLVFGEGAPGARLVFVGEGPGRDEDLAGRPFAGAAGQLLDRIIAAMGFEREDVYICNVIKCRPPNNRAPEGHECAICGPFMRRQLELIKPDVVVALGRTAARFLLRRGEALSRLRGQFYEVDGLKVMPTYHPAYLLRNSEGKRPVWQDMQMVLAELGLPVGANGRPR